MAGQVMVSMMAMVRMMGQNSLLLETTAPLPSQRKSIPDGGE